MRASIWNVTGNSEYDTHFVLSSLYAIDLSLPGQVVRFMAGSDFLLQSSGKEIKVTCLVCVRASPNDIRKQMKSFCVLLWVME